MDLQYIEARAKKFRELDNRLSYDMALSEAILEKVIIELDNKGKIPNSKVVDK
jgi:hypothetical protein